MTPEVTGDRHKRDLELTEDNLLHLQGLWWPSNQTCTSDISAKQGAPF